MEASIKHLYIIGTPNGAATKICINKDKKYSDLLEYRNMYYANHPIAIFRFDRPLEAYNNFIMDFDASKIIDNNYALSFDKIRYYLVKQQRLQRNIPIPAMVEIGTTFMSGYKYLKYLTVERTNKIFIHDDTQVHHRTDGIVFCNEGYIE